MLERTILAACAAAFVLAALPTGAVAEEPVTNNPGDPFLEGAKEGTKFTMTGGEVKPTISIGTIICTKSLAEGEFFDPETGSLKLIFQECRTPLGINCTTPGSPSGTITTTTLPFHLKTVAHKNPETGVTEHRPGILLTPGSNNEHGPHFYTEECTFIGKIEVGGNGIVGTITKPKEEQASNTATISFGSTEAGSTTQTHRFITDHQRETEGLKPVEYDLKARVGGGETKTMALDFEGTITFAEAMKPTLKTTPIP